MQGGVEYLKIDDAGLHIAVEGKERLLGRYRRHLRRPGTPPRAGAPASKPPASRTRWSAAPTSRPNSTPSARSRDHNA
jgi:hypothetical protein